jgi:serine/threonine protein kinase
MLFTKHILCVVHQVSDDKETHTHTIDHTVTHICPPCSLPLSLLSLPPLPSPCAEYLAPEFFSNQGVDRAVDIWALGILLYEMFMFRTPFATNESINNVEALFLSIAAVQVGRVVMDLSLTVPPSLSHTLLGRVQQLLKTK